MSTWINFKELRAKLDFEQVLRHYEVEVKRKGDQHLGFCPLPNHKGSKNSPSFSANLNRGIFQCFGCGAKGNVLEFAARMEGADLKDGSALRAVAIKLQNRFCPTSDAQETKSVSAPVSPAPEKGHPEINPTVVINQPLDFELKGLETKHPYLLNRGFTAETIEHFGLGFCARGMLKDRIAIPLRDHQGQVVGYAGRVVDDKSIGDENPRYRFPGKRERDGKVFEFRKSTFLYNGFRFKAPVDDLIIVEGFASVWWLHQNGLPHAVALMGSECSEKQAELIIATVKAGGRLWLVPDGDAAGGRCTESLLVQLLPHRFVRWIKLDTDKQPTDLSAQELKAIFTV